MFRINNFMVYKSLADRPSADQVGVASCQIGSTIYVSDGLTWRLVSSNHQLLCNTVGPLVMAGDNTNFYNVVKIPLAAGQLINSALKIHGLIEFIGSGGWAFQVTLTTPGAAAGTGTALIQSFPAGTVKQWGIDSWIQFSGEQGTVVTNTQAVAVSPPTTGSDLQGTSTSQTGAFALDCTQALELQLNLFCNTTDYIQLHNFIVTQHSQTNNDVKTIDFYGDSLTFGTGSTAGNDYPSQVSRALFRPVKNRGVGGQTISQIQSRVVIPQNIERQSNALIVWMGRNNVGSGTMQADLLAAANAIYAAHGSKTAFISVTPAQTTEILGSGNRTAIIAANSALQAAFPSNYIDVLTPLATNAGEIPTASYMDATSGQVHFSNAGYAIVATTVKNFINAKGW